MKKIILPIDFSKHSEYALKVAALLAKRYNLTVYPLHMLDIQKFSISESPSAQQEKGVYLLKLAEKKFKAFLKKDYLADVNLVPIIKHYKVFSEIHKIAAEVNADAIVMGSHGATGFKEFFIGSNTEKVIRHADIPVLIIKNEMNDVSFSNIVIATDFSEKSVPAFKKSLQTLDFLKAKKQILYVNLPNENFKTTPEMEAMANRFLMKVEGNIDRLINVNFVAAKSIEKGILNFANVTGADLIVMITHGRKGISHIFEGSISEDLSNHASLPIMTFKL